MANNRPMYTYYTLHGHNSDRKCGVKNTCTLSSRKFTNQSPVQDNRSHYGSQVSRPILDSIQVHASHAFKTFKGKNFTSKSGTKIAKTKSRAVWISSALYACAECVKSRDCVSGDDTIQ
jgi:hypothetical protein